jgi:hypothetical protein
MRLNIIFYATILPYRSVCGIKDIMSTLDTQNLLEYNTQLTTSDDSSPECGTIMSNKNVLKPSLDKDSLNHQTIENSELLNNKTRLNNNKLTQEDINRARQKLAADDSALSSRNFSCLTPFQIDQLTSPSPVLCFGKREPENAELKTENAELKTENAELKTENIELKTENIALKAENTELKAENIELKAKDEENTFKIDGYKAIIKDRDKEIEKCQLIIGTPKANSSNSSLSPNKDINSAARRRKEILEGTKKAR